MRSHILRYETKNYKSKTKKKNKNKLKHGIGEGRTFGRMDAESSSRPIPTLGTETEQRPIFSRFCAEHCEIGIERLKPNLARSEKALRNQGFYEDGERERAS